MVVISAARIAQRNPRTHITVLRGLGIRIRFKLPRLLELTSDLTEISDVTLNLVPFGSSTAPPARHASTGAQRLECAIASPNKSKAAATRSPSWSVRAWFPQPRKTTNLGR